MLKVAGGGAGGGGTPGALVYQGTWNASSNTPTLASGVGTQGFYYVVSVAGTTNLDGINDWQIGDWAVFNGTTWQKIDNTDVVTSVNGKVGAVVLSASDVGATPNTTYVIAGTGMSGGGQLTGNVTVNLANTAVVAGTYGDSTHVAQVTVDPQGRITTISNVAILASGVGTVTSVLTGTGLTGGPITATGTISIANTTVTPGSYGNASTVGTFTVNAQGQLTAAANATISIPASAINTTIPNSGLTNSAVTINGTAISLGGSGTITASTTGTLTLGTGLTGTSFNGSTNVTTNLANTTVVAGSYGNASYTGSFTVDAQGRLTAASATQISIPVGQVSGAVPNTRLISTGTGLTGGGDLSADRTLSVVANTTQQLVAVQNNGVLVGTRQVHNFIPGTNVSITTSDDSANGRANVTIGVSGFVSAETWQGVQSTNFNALAGNAYPINTSGGAVTVTLPASPVAGNIIWLTDYNANWGNNNVTVALNGNKFNGGTTNLVLKTPAMSIALVYIDSTQGWLAYSGFVQNPGGYSVSYLVVAGGGGGGTGPGAGGGAGGMLTGKTFLASGTTYSITVGGGGAAATGTYPSASSAQGSSGSNSVFGSIATATGGGGGAGNSVGNFNGVAGGSGGGASGASGTGGSGTSGQGNAGGNGLSAGGDGAGGGGAGAAGAATLTTGSAGNGGVGLASSITGSSVFYAGGGGGGGNSGSAPSGSSNHGTGGNGGGGDGGWSSTLAAVAGTANRGGGGGGGGRLAGTNNYAAAAGGSGVVILSIPSASYTGTTTGSPTVTTSGVNTILTFNSSGSYTA